MRPPRAEWPAVLREHPLVAGVSVGKCEATGRPVGGRLFAHAHFTTCRRAPGWICYRSAATLADAETALHELAHIISGEGHTKRFRRILRELGGDMTHWSERERTAAKGPVRHSWEAIYPNPKAAGYSYGRCRRCGVTRHGMFPWVGYRHDGVHLDARPDCFTPGVNS